MCVATSRGGVFRGRWLASRSRPNGDAGWQESDLGGPVYVMPSTSGLNAHSLTDLTDHLRHAATGRQ